MFANYLQISSEDYTLIGIPQSVLYQTNYISQLKILPLTKHASLLSYTAIDLLSIDTCGQFNKHFQPVTYGCSKMRVVALVVKLINDWIKWLDHLEQVAVVILAELSNWLN